MPPVNAVLLLASSLLAAGLLGIGFGFGRRRLKKQAILLASDAPVVDEEDRRRIVEILQNIARWTSEYSGNVSDYQSDLEQISREMRSNLKSKRGNGKTPAPNSPTEAQILEDARTLALLTQIMSSNTALQTRLSAAEQQLEEQTQQIESYLTEARTDSLTGLRNRRAFDKKLDELFANYRGGGSSFVLILVDIDHFKDVNDNYGHPVGDIVLQRIASFLGAGLSDAKIVARFGGEEFAILTDIPIRIAAGRMNKLRQRIAEETIPAQRESIQITMSVGLSEPRDEIVIGPIVRRADEALYCAKNRGRNRVYFDDGSGPQLFGAPEVVRK